MMGSSDTPQKPFFCGFNLDDAVPQDHLLRSINRFLDLSDLLSIWLLITVTRGVLRSILS
jgi:hypothetical protein